MNHVPRFIERFIKRFIGTCPTWQRVMPHVWIRWSHTFIKRFLDTCRWIVSHIFVGVSLWMRHVKQLWHNSSTRVAWHTYQRVMPHVWIRSSHKYGWTAPDGSCQMQKKVAFAEVMPNQISSHTCGWAAPYRSCQRHEYVSFANLPPYLLIECPVYSTPVTGDTKNCIRWTNTLPTLIQSHVWVSSAG